MDMRIMFFYRCYVMLFYNIDYKSIYVLCKDNKIGASLKQKGKTMDNF
jgi:hypothetical protein